MLNSTSSPTRHNDSTTFDTKLSENTIQTATALNQKSPNHLTRISENPRIAIRRFDSRQVPHKKVLKPPLAVGAASAVTAIGDEKKIEIFACANEGIHKPIRALRRYVFIHLASDQHQIPLE